MGKVPDPKSQVEQITIALIYKFMWDIDAQSEELGGERSFFVGEFDRYGWPRLMHAGLGGHATLNLYAEAITRIPENPGVPPLFRGIFNNAYLPYRDPETLRAFLKIIDEFEYDHSERLGDAFEYLLSVMGAQGDAGQFRTPRHIIDFIVAAIDPKKHETVLDPACGTAGFLISSYKHILAANRDEHGQSTLTPDDRGRLADNVMGYDISPDMVRLSLVNLYLHGFADPRIHEYDTLTSEERWSQHADVILANPPFMSPKGGIRPHNRFSVPSKRSEVLFVDYMAEHLTPAGRAGIIVPEGIIFQSQRAHTRLRQMLVDDSLVAVVSLPAGVFKPYSGVKTSILILDRALARRTDRIAFFKIENDGFDLGDQRRPIDKNDLPQVQAELTDYLGRVRAGELLNAFQPSLGLVVEKERIAADGDYNLSGERYRENDLQIRQFSMLKVGEIAREIKTGFACGRAKTDIAGVPHIRPMNISAAGTFTWQGVKNISEHDYRGKEDYSLEPHDILFNNTNSEELVGKTCLVTEQICGGYSNHITRIRTRTEHCDARYLALVIHSAWRNGVFAMRATRWVGQAGINRKSLSEFEVPLPSLEVQQEIVAEIEGYQKVIDGARTVIDNYRPHIHIDPDWPVVAVGDIASPEYGFTATANEQGDTRFIRITDITKGGTLSSEVPKFINLTDAARKSLLAKGDVLVARTGATYGKTMLFDEDQQAAFASYLIRLRFPPDLIHSAYYWAFAQSDSYWTQARALVTGGGQQQFNGNAIKQVRLPLPPLPIQEAIVSELDAERVLVAVNRELIDRFEQKIESSITRIWEG